MLPKEELVKSVDYLFKNINLKNVQKYKPRQTYNFVINGKSLSGKDSFIECVSRFTLVNNISTIDPIKQMASIVELENNRDFLRHLKELVYRYTNYIDDYVSNHLKPGHLNFVHIREEKYFNKSPYTWMIKVLVDRLDNDSNEFTRLSNFKFNYNRYQHIIKNESLETLPHKALQFVQIYCDRFDEI